MRTLAAIIAVLISSTAFANEPVKVKPPANKSLASENGRYVFGQVSELRRDQYMLDTKTGKLWNIVAATTGEGAAKTDSPVIVLQPVPYVQSDGKYSPEP